MPLKTKTKTIDGVKLSVTQFAAMRALRMSARLGRVLGPAATKVKGVSADMDVSALGPAIGELFAHLTPDEAAELARELLAGSVAVVDNKQIELDDDESINAVFNGRMKAFLGALRFALEVNFGDFLSAAGLDDKEDAAAASD